MLDRNVGVFLMTVLLAGSVLAGVLNPIDVTGWNEDVVIATDDIATAGASAVMDGVGVDSGATVWYEQGFNSSAPDTGLQSGLLESESTVGLFFQLQSFYGNNAVYKGGALTLTTAAEYDRIALIGAAGNGTANLTITFKYTTGSDQVFSIGTGEAICQDWFNGSSITYTADGRVSTISGNFDYVDSGNPRLYESIFDVDQTRLLQSVVITDHDAALEDPRSVIMAISGEAVPEPASVALIGLASGFILFIRRRFSA